MRLRFPIAGLSAVLFLSGWGGVWASAECRRAGHGEGAKAAHACCHAEAAQASSSHCSTLKAEASFVESSRAVSLPPEACQHCFVRSENPPARFALPEPHARKRGDTTDAPRAWNAFDSVPFYFRPPISDSRGGAPPGSSSATARHLLLSVFLI